MADNDFNIIKPVENLQNVGGLTPAKRREQRKKRQNMREKKDLQRPFTENEQSEAAAEDFDGEINCDDQDRHSVDYCA